MSETETEAAPPVAKPKTYLDLAKEAILALKDRSGSSPQAIKAYITTTYPAVRFQQHLLRSALKKGEETKRLIKVKSSFKLAPEPKKLDPKEKKALKKAKAKKKKEKAKKKAKDEAKAAKKAIKEAVKAEKKAVKDAEKAAKKAAKAAAAPAKKAAAPKAASAPPKKTPAAKV